MDKEKLIEIIWTIADVIALTALAIEMFLVFRVMKGV